MDLISVSSVSCLVRETIASITNKILQTGVWPDEFKTTWVSVIAKKNDPKDKNDLKAQRLSSPQIEDFWCIYLLLH